MEFDNHFTVNAPLQRVWEFLLNVQEVAPCMPGAQLTDVVSDTEYQGTVKVKLGAVQMSYKGTATITEINEETHTVVLVASGRETRGTGNASTTTTSHLVEEGPNRTKVDLHSQVEIAGRVAQFGRSIMQDVASRLIAEFARNLEAKMMAEPESSPVEAAPPTTSDAPASTASDAAPLTFESAPPRVVAPVAVRTPASPAAQDSQPIKMLPIVAGVARSQVARGLRKLASIVEPNE